LKNEHNLPVGVQRRKKCSIQQKCLHCDHILFFPPSSCCLCLHLALPESLRHEVFWKESSDVSSTSTILMVFLFPVNARSYAAWKCHVLRLTRGEQHRRWLVVPLCWTGQIDRLAVRWVMAHKIVVIACGSAFYYAAGSLKRSLLNRIAM